MSAKFIMAGILAAAVATIVAMVAPAVRHAAERRELRDQILARNAAYDRTNPPRVGLARDPDVDLDALDVQAACAPVVGVVDKAACGQARARQAEFERALPPR